LAGNSNEGGLNALTSNGESSLSALEERNLMEGDDSAVEERNLMDGDDSAVEERNLMEADDSAVEERNLMQGDDTFPSQDTHQRNFENHMKSLHWSICSTCNEKFMDGKKSRKCIHTPDLCEKLSAKNNMDPCPVPVELQGLSYVEKQLIARVHPVVSVYKINGHQLGYRGNVINFPQNITKIATVLPPRVNDLRSIIIIRSFWKDTYKDFHVCGQRVL